MADSSHHKGEKLREKVYVSIEKCERERERANVYERVEYEC